MKNIYFYQLRENDIVSVIESGVIVSEYRWSWLWLLWLLLLLAKKSACLHNFLFSLNIFCGGLFMVYGVSSIFTKFPCYAYDPSQSTDRPELKAQRLNSIQQRKWSINIQFLGKQGVPLFANCSAIRGLDDCDEVLCSVHFLYVMLSNTPGNLASALW